MVLWLRHCTFIAEGTGSVSGQGSKILQAVWILKFFKIKLNLILIKFNLN